MKHIYASAAEDPVAVGRVTMSRGFDGHGGERMAFIEINGEINTYGVK